MISASAFVSDLEQISGKAFTFRAELVLLIDSALASGRMEILRDAAFHAKFVTKTQDVMKRIGPKGEGYDKLAAEFQVSLEKIAARIREIMSTAPADERSAFEDRFLRLDPSSLNELLGLSAELSWIKNWEVDGKPLPGASEAAEPSLDPASPFRLSEVNHAFRSAILGALLIGIYVFMEPPISLFGLALAALGIVQFIHVILHLYKTRRFISGPKG